MNSAFFVERIRNRWAEPVGATEEMARTLKAKPLLLEWYRGIYRFLADRRAPGQRNLEIGSGSSLLHEHVPDLTTSNILDLDNIDLACSAYELPFHDRVLDNIFLISVLHHLADPLGFLKEASRVLRIEGRVLISDPYVSALSWVPWMKLHPEYCDLSQLGFEPSNPPNPLADANSANLTILFGPGTRSEDQITPLVLDTFRFHSKFHYWLAGGYNFPQFLPTRWLPAIVAAERLLSPFDRFLASFAFVVLRKAAPK